MRIIIAEDELLERKAMKKFIAENFPSIEVVAEAENGRKAIQLAAEKNPDVMLMDIKMPGISGLESIETIQKVQPHIKFIIVSAYDSFAYAKKAMQFGIKDYILKPSRKEEIVQTLLRVEKEINAACKRRKEKYQAKELLQEQLLRKVMQHPITDEVKQLQQQLFAQMKCGTFLVVHTSVPSGVVKMDLQQPSGVACITTLSGEFHIILIMTANVMKKETLLMLAKKLQLQLAGETFIGIGEICNRIEAFPDAYEQAYAACLQQMELRTSGYGFLRREMSQSHANPALKQLYREVEKGHGEQAGLLMKKYNETANANELETWYIHVMQLLQNKNIPLEPELFSLKQACKDWAAFAQLCAGKMHTYYQSKKYVAQIENYVRTHFQEGITLHDAAASIDLSPTYFSNLFKQEFGINFTDYVTKLRMEKAKEMIEENKLSMKEISYMLGYRDPNYFSRVFKKYFAESPKTFQKSILK